MNLTVSVVERKLTLPALCRCILGRIPHLQFLGGESGGRSVPGGSKLQPDLPPDSQQAAAQLKPPAAQPAGLTPGPAAETAQQVRRQGRGVGWWWEGGLKAYS